MSDSENQNVETFEYKAEMQQLLHLIVHSLYTHPEVFLRELISNASDALNKVRVMKLTNQDILDADGPLQVKIVVDKKENTFSIEDSGIGMTHEELVQRIGTVASSGTLDFVKQVKDQGESATADLIGKFGVGFYSIFMVTDEVVVETRHAAKDGKGYRWTSKGEGTYTIEEIEMPARGTKVSFTLKDEFEEFADEFRVKNIIKKYSNFVDFPLFVGEEEVNTVDALWQKNKDDVKEEERNEFYKFVSNDFQDPMAHMHLSIEGRVNFKALVFIPPVAPPSYYRGEEEKTLSLYSNKVMIMESCADLVPEYLRFLRGVVDTEDLPLNVSREVTQNSPVMGKIREVITGRILNMLEEWSDKDDERFDTFWKQFGSRFKTGVNSDFANKQRVIELLRFETTMSEDGKLIQLEQYVKNMKESQKEIYYLFGENRDVLLRNPKLEYFKKKGLEVLLLTDPVDLFTITFIPDYEEKPLQSIEKADIELDEDEEKEDAETTEAGKPLIELFKEILGDKIEDVRSSKRLVDSPATLVVSKEGMDVHMERMMKMMNPDMETSKKILELNLSHPLLKNIAAMKEKDGDNTRVEKFVQQIYEGAVLLDGNLTSPTDFVTRMTQFMVDASK
jgi:molecular chaperone HtpG